MSKNNPLTKSSVIKMMSNRVNVPVTAIGKRVRLLVTSAGNEIEVTNRKGELVPSMREGGTPLRKMIFNTNGNSSIAMSNERNKQYFINGRNAELKGGTVAGEIKGVKGDFTADEWFSAYLNATQISFGVLLPNRLIDNGFLQQGVEIAGTIEKIDGDNGSILSVVSNSIAVQAPETLHTIAFDEESMFGATGDDSLSTKKEEPALTQSEIKAKLELEKKEKKAAADAKKAADKAAKK